MITCAHGHMITCTNDHMITCAHGQMITWAHGQMITFTHVQMITCAHGQMTTCTHGIHAYGGETASGFMHTEGSAARSNAGISDVGSSSSCTQLLFRQQLFCQML